MSHPLLKLFHDAARGEFPPVDGVAAVLPALDRGLEASVGFTGHAVVATALTAAEVAACRPDGFGAALAPDFLRRLAGPRGSIGTIDVTLFARGTGGPQRIQRDDAVDHPRVRHARELREDVRVYRDARGLVTLASGLAGRLELSIEAEPGSGRSLLRDGLGLVPAGEPVFAAVAPGNARSLRAFLASGFTPIGSEVILRPERQ